MKTFAEYHEFITKGGCSYTDELPVAYDAIKMAGETGEVCELVGKDMRPELHRVPLDKIKVIMEIGDVLWYVGKMAAKLGYTIEQVASANRLKLSLRQRCGKDPESEYSMIAGLLRNYDGA